MEPENPQSPPPAQPATAPSDNAPQQAAQQSPDAPSSQSAASSKPAPVPSNDQPSAGQSEDQQQDEPATPASVAGYDPASLLKAPLEPPVAEQTEGAKATKSRSVKFLMSIGIALVVVGLLLILAFSGVFGFIVMFLGAAAVMVAVFAPL